MDEFKITTTESSIKKAITHTVRVNDDLEFFVKLDIEDEKLTKITMQGKSLIDGRLTEAIWMTPVMAKALRRILNLNYTEELLNESDRSSKQVDL